ncbi:MAG: hypothetical protein WBA41_22345 [Rivularia sp. (in: cyanobacteria)]
MQIESTQNVELQAKKPRTITIILNEHPVTFSQNNATGLEIKQTAIKQCVSIKEDFILFEVKCDSSLKQVGDCEAITAGGDNVSALLHSNDNS